MRYSKFKEILNQSGVFTNAEAHYISRTADNFTLRNVIVACGIGGIELSKAGIGVLTELFRNGS